jgi:hypothetical protein
VPVDDEAGDPAHRRPVAALQGVEQQLPDARVVQVAQPAAGATARSGRRAVRTGTVAGAGAVRLRVAVALLAGGGRRRLEREEQVEDDVERRLVLRRLHQRGAQPGLHRRPVGQPDVLERADGVQVLGRRHRDADLAQLPDQPLDGGEHGLTPTRSRRGRR